MNKIFESLKNTICLKFGPNPAKMLIYTGILGWFLSSAAQVTAIAVNNKIPKEQKSFLIPQEISDGAVNVISFFLITSSVKALASKLVSTGKLATPKIRDFLKKSGISSKKLLGNVNFDIAESFKFKELKHEYLTLKSKYPNMDFKITPKDKPQFDEFCKCYTNLHPQKTFTNEALGEKLSDLNFVEHYTEFKNGIDVLGMTVGSIISCNLVTPLLRNRYAAQRQKYSIEKSKEHELTSPKGITLDQYQNLASSKYSGSLKI